MSGNVADWCGDWWDGSDYSIEPVTDPTGDTSGTSRVVRGGHWESKPRSLRSAFRGSTEPDLRSRQIGFRLALPSDQ